RLAGAPDPVAQTDTRSEESLDDYWKLVRAAERAALAGNMVKAAVLRTRAARIAPAARTKPTRDQAENDVRQPCERLAPALSLSPAETTDWSRHLVLLLAKADQR